MLVLALQPAAAFTPSAAQVGLPSGSPAFTGPRPAVGSAQNCFSQRLPVTLMSTDSERSEMLKLKAEKAKLAAEQAELELEKMRLEAQKLKVKALASQGLSEQSPSNEALSQASQPPQAPEVAVRVPGAKWPGERGKFHRFIEDDQTSILFSKTREILAVARREGTYEGTFRVQFTLPGKEKEPKTIELLQMSKGNPKFGAVIMKVRSFSSYINPPKKFPVDDSIKQFTDNFDPSSQRLVVTGVVDLDNPAMKKGDIIRGVSVMKTKSTKEGQDFLVQFQKLRQKVQTLAMPDLDENMAMLDHDVSNAFEAALKENLRLNDQLAEVVVLIERPDEAGDVSDDSDRNVFSGMFR